MNEHERPRPLSRPIGRRRALAGIAAGAGAAVSLLACGGSSKSGAGAAAPAGRAGTPKYGGRLNVALPTDPYDFDPTGKPSENTNGMRPAYESLLSFKTGPDVNPADIVLRPGLAERWESPDGQTYIFHLQQGVKFANLSPVNGREVTTADARWSMEYLSRTGRLAEDKKLFPALNSWAFEGIDRIETPSAQTLTTHFGAPFAPFLNYMAQFWFPVLAHEIYDQDGNFSSRIVGTGPWQLDTVASQKGTRWVYKRNPSYFRKGLPYIDQINWLVIPQDSTQLAAFQTRQLDVLGADNSPITDTNVAQIARDNPGAVRYGYPSTKGGIIYMNVTRPPLTDERIRKAIAFGIDRAELVKVFAGGKAGWAAVAETPGFFTQQELEQMLVFDPTQARQLVSQAGYPNGVDVELINPGTDRGQKEVEMIQLLQAQLKKVNINVVYHPLDRAAEGLRKKSHDFQLDIVSGGASDDIDAALYGNFYSKSDKNYGRTDDPELDKLLVAQRQELDATKRREICRQAIRRIYDRVWSLSFFFATRYQFAHPALKNYAPHSFARGLSIADSWLDK